MKKDLRCDCGAEMYVRPDGHIHCKGLAEAELARLKAEFNAEINKGRG